MEEIDSTIIVKSFKNCWISNAMDGTEDNVLFDDEGETDIDPFADLEKDSDEDVNKKSTSSNFT